PHLEQQITYIATLFPNPLQILARSGAKSIRDLNGKKVNFNNKGSATAQFVPKIFKTLGVNVQQEFFLAQGDALEKLRSGEIDATICSCPVPVRRMPMSNRNGACGLLLYPTRSRSRRSICLPR